ncbi:MAG: carbohydrate ABC transporter permease [Firmicutes bacterium]|nr:carbohydrate ABC transporter permease [Bacillota bacterium]
MTAVRYTKNILIYVCLIILAVIFAGPFIAMFLVAFQANPVTSARDIFNLNFTLSNFIRVFNESRLARWFLNSVITTGVVTVFGTFFSSLSAYVMAKKDFPGKELIFWLFLAVLMFPAHAWIIPMFIQMSRMGLVNTYWPFFLSGTSSAFGIFLLRQYIEQNVVSDILEAARIDGCGEFRTYFHIVLPTIIPGLITLAIFLFIQWWGQFMFALIMTTSGDMYTLPVGVALIRGVAQSNLRFVMATTAVAVLPSIVVFIFFQNYLMRGVVMQLD